MAAQDALQVMKIEKDKQFLLAQREEGRRGSMGRVDKTLADKEKGAKKKSSSKFQYNIGETWPITCSQKPDQIQFCKW